MHPSPPRAPGPPRGLEADCARVKGGRRARRPGEVGRLGRGSPRAIYCGRAPPQPPLAAAASGRPEPLSSSSRGPPSPVAPPASQRGRWGLRSPARELGLAAGRSARRPPLASCGGGRLSLGRDYGLSEEGAWRAWGGGWRGERTEIRSPGLSASGPLASIHYILKSFLPLVSAASGKIYRFH